MCKTIKKMKWRGITIQNKFLKNRLPLVNLKLKAIWSLNLHNYIYIFDDSFFDTVPPQEPSGSKQYPQFYVAMLPYETSEKYIPYKNIASGRLQRDYRVSFCF